MIWGLIDAARFEDAQWAWLPKVAPYLDGVWLRAPTFTLEEWVDWGRRIRRSVPQIPLWVGHLAAATALDAEGVQVSSTGPTAAWIKKRWTREVAASVHQVAEARYHEAADLWIWGHAFETRSKPGLAPRARTHLMELLAEPARPPVLVVGGITVETVGEVAGWGVQGLVVGDGIWRTLAPAEASRKIRQIWDERREKPSHPVSKEGMRFDGFD
ncbi:MAG: thiamine phosphate synthase [Sulfobacillus sp.]|nr:thiamine phosphate synthase [Sulfobacillus sp.]